MKTLTIEVLQHYLAHGLEMYHLDLAKSLGLGMKYVPSKLKRLTVNGLFWVGKETGSRKIDDTVYKPVLYPLSHLTKPITVDGKEIVPIVELLKPHFNLNPKDLGWVGSHITYQGRRLICVAPDLLDLRLDQFQWLFKHHFNVFGLDESLYIDKSTIQ